MLQQQSGCLIIRQPLEEEPDLDGLGVDKLIKGKWVTVAYSNTAKTNEKQVFCAAHELGHICGMERYLRDKFPEELLIPREDFLLQCSL